MPGISARSASSKEAPCPQLCLYNSDWAFANELGLSNTINEVWQRVDGANITVVFGVNGVREVLEPFRGL